MSAIPSLYELRPAHILLLVFAISAQACTAGMATRFEEPTAPATPLSLERLAIMPVTTEAGSEGVRPGLARDLHREMEMRFPHLEIVGPEATADRLASSPAASMYARILADYERTGVVESERLAEIADAIGVDHFLQLRAGFVREEFLDADPFLDDEVETEQRQVLAVVVRLWGDRGPGPVWEAVVQTSSETSFFTPRGRSVDELIGELVSVIGERMPLAGS